MNVFNLQTERPALQSFHKMLIPLVYGMAMCLLPDPKFKDFMNYIEFINNISVIADDYFDRSLLVIITNEPLFIIINLTLSLFFSNETALRILIFVGAFASLWAVLRNHPRHFLLVILIFLFPQVMKNYLVHLRQGLAIGLFLFGWYMTAPRLRLFIIGLTPLIHASFFIIIFILCLSWLIHKAKFDAFVNVLISAAVLFFIVINLGTIAELFGARQVGWYKFTVSNLSGFGFVFWFALFSVCFLSSKTWLRNHIYEINMIVFYLAGYWLIDVGARVLESGLILICLAGLSLQYNRKIVFYFLLLGVNLSLWASRFNMSGLGFYS